MSGIQEQPPMATYRPLRASPLLPLLVSLLALLPGGAAADNRGDYSGAMPTTYPDWFKPSFLEFAAAIRESGRDVDIWR